MIDSENSREKLNEYLNKKMAEISKPSDRRELYDQILNKFNMKSDDVNDFITFKKDIREASDFEVFILLWFINRNKLKDYFTQNEIEVLSNERLPDNNVLEYPLTFDVVQVTEDQWIGKTSFKQLMKMKDVRLINYDENEQRAFRHIKTNSRVMFRIFINKKAVKEIKTSIQSGRYIPDDITLNMPEGSDYSYNNGKLVVNKLPNDKFNIIDGYHRWLSMSEIYNFDKEFDYPMELRIVSYSTEKANQFIFQKDQKTQMKKVDSSSYNQYSVSNRVVQRLNEDPSSNMQGMIARNDGKISASSLAAVIFSYYVKTKAADSENNPAKIVAIKNDIQKKFNTLSEKDLSYLNTRYTDRLLVIMFHIFTSDIAENDYPAAIKYLAENADNFSLTNGAVRRKTKTMLDDCLDRWKEGCK